MDPDAVRRSHREGLLEEPGRVVAVPGSQWRVESGNVHPGPWLASGCVPQHVVRAGPEPEYGVTVKKVLYILGELEEADIEWLISSGRKTTVEQGRAIIREGVPLDALYIVIEGGFSVTAGSREIAQIGAGEVLGEISYVDSRPPTATVTATMDSQVLSVPRRALSEKLSSDLGFGSRFYRSLAVFLADRLRDTVNQLGYGREEHLDPEDTNLAPDELDLSQLHTLSQAGVRFERLLQRMQDL